MQGPVRPTRTSFPCGKRLTQTFHSENKPTPSTRGCNSYCEAELPAWAKELLFATVPRKTVSAVSVIFVVHNLLASIIQNATHASGTVNTSPNQGPDSMPLRLLHCCLLSSLIIVFIGCVGSGGGSTNPPSPPPPQPSSTLNLSPNQIDLSQNSTQSFQIEAIPQNGFSAAVAVTINGKPRSHARGLV